MAVTAGTQATQKAALVSRVIPSPNIKPPKPPNLKHSPYNMIHHIMGVFNSWGGDVFQ